MFRFSLLLLVLSGCASDKPNYVMDCLNQIRDGDMGRQSYVRVGKGLVPDIQYCHAWARWRWQVK